VSRVMEHLHLLSVLTVHTKLHQISRTQKAHNVTNKSATSELQLQAVKVKSCIVYSRWKYSI